MAITGLWALLVTHLLHLCIARTTIGSPDNDMKVIPSAGEATQNVGECFRMVNRQATDDGAFVRVVSKMPT